jgi:hypothetical protein
MTQNLGALVAKMAALRGGEGGIQDTAQSQDPRFAEGAKGRREHLIRNPTRAGCIVPLRVVVMAILVWVIPFPLAVPGARVAAQNLDKAVTTVEEEVTAFAYAPDGRIVYSVRRMFKAKKYDLQRDDIWILELNGKRRRLFEGQKFIPGDKPFTYQVEAFTWSPNGHIIAVELFTSSVDPDDGRTEDARALLLLDDGGHELHTAGKDPLVMNAQNPIWLRDNATIVYMTGVDTPTGLFELKYLFLSSGPAQKAFEGRTFIDVARISGSNTAIAVERDRNQDGPARLQRLELLGQEDKEVATLDSFLGEISVSPSGLKVAYFVDKEVLEIRDLTAVPRVTRMRVGLGVLQWSPDESRIYLKRTIEKKSADLVAFTVPALVAYGRNPIPVQEPEPQVLLHGLTVREYSLSRDGRFLAVVLPGKRNLQVFGF